MDIKIKTALSNFILTRYVTAQIISELKQSMQNYKSQSRSNLMKIGWPNFGLSNKQTLRRICQKYVTICKSLTSSKMMKYFLLIDDIGPFSLTWDGFLPTIQMIGTEQQVKFYQSQLYSSKMIGAYGQTQISHGSDVKSLQLRADYNISNGKFILNTQKPHGIKIWAGGLGVFCTHAVVQAQTYVKDRHIGLQTFVVMIRDSQNQFKQPKGIIAGDIGKKLGFKRVDNGFLKFQNHQIPRDAMLSRFIQVNKDGSVSGLQNKQAIKYGYSSMLLLRFKLASNFSIQLVYACKLFKPQNQIQYQIVAKQISLALGMYFANSKAFQKLQQYKKCYNQKNFQKADILLANCHVIGSTFKALFSWSLLRGVVQLIQSSSRGLFVGSGLLKIFYQLIPSVTYQGDNNVLLQQTAGYLLKNGCNYQGSSLLIKQLTQRLNEQVLFIKRRLQSLVSQGIQPKKAWNQKMQVQLIQLSKMFGWVKLIQFSQQVVQQTKDTQLYPILCKVQRGLQNYAGQHLSVLKRNGYQNSGLNYSQIDMILSSIQNRGHRQQQSFQLGSKQAAELGGRCIKYGNL